MPGHECKAPASYPETPELDRQHEVLDRSHAAGDFIDWLGTQGLVIAQYGSDGQWYPAYIPPERLLADWLGIDLDKVEAERRAILAHLREHQS